MLHGKDILQNMQKDCNTPPKTGEENKMRKVKLPASNTKLQFPCYGYINEFRVKDGIVRE
jgi:hypothetical protein